MLLRWLRLHLYSSFKLRDHPHLLARVDLLTGRWEEPWPERSDLTPHPHVHKPGTRRSPLENGGFFAIQGSSTFKQLCCLLQVLLIALYFPLCLPFLQIHGFESKS